MMVNCCVVCGKHIGPGSNVCAFCENDMVNEAVRFSPGMAVLLTSSVSLKLIALYQKYFSRPEVQDAFEVYSQSLCDEPSQSLVPSFEKGAAECTL